MHVGVRCLETLRNERCLTLPVRCRPLVSEYHSPLAMQTWGQKPRMWAGSESLAQQGAAAGAPTGYLGRRENVVLLEKHNYLMGYFSHFALRYAWYLFLWFHQGNFREVQKPFSLGNPDCRGLSSAAKWTQKKNYTSNCPGH